MHAQCYAEGGRGRHAVWGEHRVNRPAASGSLSTSLSHSSRPTLSPPRRAAQRLLLYRRPRKAPAPLRLRRHEHTRQSASALPFLLLGPLASVGYLKALDATLEAADALDAMPLYAAALAYKTLAPPVRGWRREPWAITSASAFAALSQPAAEPSLVELARRLSDYLSPLDAALSGALMRGHTPEQPLLLLRTGPDAEGGFLLSDVEGAFPLRWAQSVEGLRQVLIELDSSVVLIPQATAGVELLRWMDEEGLRFITDAVPTRGEHWRAVRRSPQERWWTNETIMSDSAITQKARALSGAAEDAAAVWQALHAERPSIPLADDARLERHLTLAASTALGTIAWELWREREPTAPHLALERFSNLDALVVYTREAVQVSLPLGKRFQDLRDYGLIDDVADVPWFDGRRLTFTSG